jgi:hypothetical protein
MVRDRLDSESSGCANSDYWFLTPAAPLSSYTEYTLQVRSPDAFVQGFISIAAEDVTFTTGDSLRAAGSPEVQLSLYGVDSPSGRLLELFLESDWPEPLFVQGRGGSRPQTRTWAPWHTPGPYPLSLGAAECAEVVILDVAGGVVLSEARCAPSKCTTTSLLRGGMCGGEIGAPFTWDDWQQLPEGCGEGADDEPIDVVSSAPEAAAGCQLAVPRAPHAALLAGSYLLVCLRRRSRRAASAR